jgi:hypothetical protein
MSCATGSIGDAFNESNFDAGNHVMSAVYSMEKNGHATSGTTAAGMIANIVTYGFFTGLTTCKQSFVNKQELDIDCTEQVEKVRKNVNCEKCIRMAKYAISSRKQLDEKAHKINSSYKIPVANSETLSKFVGNNTTDDDIAAAGCRYMCFDCVVENFDQNMTMTMNATCNVTSKVFRTAMSSGMSAQAFFEMSKHQSELRKTGLKINSVNHLKEFSTNLSANIEIITKDCILNSLRQDAINLQRMKISGNSLVAQNFKQTITFLSFSKMVSQAYELNFVKNKINFQTNEKVLQERTTINDLFKDLNSTVDDLKDAFRNIIGYVLVILLSLLFTVIVTIAFVMYFKPNFLMGGLKDVVS